MSVPQEISPDGREVWDWAERLIDRMQRFHRIRELSAAIREGESTCGSCDRWMTNDCPRERRGRFGEKVGGPICKSIKCDQFLMKNWDAKRIQGLREELKQLEQAA